MRPTSSRSTTTRGGSIGPPATATGTSAARTARCPITGSDATDFWLPDLPGRRGFDFAHAALGSRVEPVVADFATVDLHALGAFDVVLYLGVLYHMKEPLTCSRHRARRRPARSR